MDVERERWRIRQVEFETRPFTLKKGKRRKRLGQNQGRLLLFLVHHFRDYPEHTNDQIKHYVWNQIRSDSSLHQAAHILERALGGKKGDYIATRPYHLVVKPQRIATIGTPHSFEPRTVRDADQSSEPLSRAESLRERGRPLAAESLLSAGVKSGAHLLSAEYIEKLKSIRDRNTLEFFNPNNDLSTTMVFDRAYENRTPGNEVSTTQDWVFKVWAALKDIERIYQTKPPQHRPARYRVPTIHRLLKESRNLISYASSKINPCTEYMLEELNERLGLDLRFIYESDIGREKRSTFTRTRERDRAALIFRGTALKFRQESSEGHDYGILFRYCFPDKQWLIFAGCSRPGSVAAGKLVFDREFGEALWSRPDLQEPLRSFLCIFRTSFIPPNTNKPHRVEIVEFLEFQ